MRKPQKALLAAGGVLVAAGAVFLARHDPESWNVPLFCPFHAITGFLCPGCGSLRAIHDLLNLRVADAFRHNSLSSALLILAPVALLLRGLLRRSPLWGAGFTLVMTAFWIMRNL
ncbi:MAG: DUF2752 domain-containing protein [Candidatus Fermentibacteraceae bacterium]